MPPFFANSVVQSTSMELLLTGFESFGGSTVNPSAGAYLCNQVLTTRMDHLANSNKPIPAGFIHLPALPEQAAPSGVAIPSMSFNIGVKGIELTLEVISQWLKKKNDFGGNDETFPG